MLIPEVGNMEIKIQRKKTLYLNGFEYFATININGAFFKEIGGVSRITDLLNIIADDHEIITHAHLGFIQKEGEKKNGKQL